MTRTTIIGVKRAARRAVVPVLAALAVAVGTSSVFADATAVTIDTAASVTASGQLAVSGSYQCDPSTAAYAELSVSAGGSDVNGDEVDASVSDRVACTGGPQPWQETLTPAEACETFAPGSADVEVAAWTPGDWDGQRDISTTVPVS